MGEHPFLINRDEFHNPTATKSTKYYILIFSENTSFTIIFLPLNSIIIHDLPTSCPAPLKTSKTLQLIKVVAVACWSNFGNNSVYLQRSNEQLVTFFGRNLRVRFSFCSHIFKCLESSYGITKLTEQKVNLYTQHNTQQINSLFGH